MGEGIRFAGQIAGQTGNNSFIGAVLIKISINISFTTIIYARKYEKVRKYKRNYNRLIMMHICKKH
jgi:hypothetical protein